MAIQSAGTVVSRRSAIDHPSDRFTIKTRGGSPLDGAKLSVKDRFRTAKSCTSGLQRAAGQMPKSLPSDCSALQPSDEPLRAEWAAQAGRAVTAVLPGTHRGETGRARCEKATAETGRLDSRKSATDPIRSPIGRGDQPKSTSGGNGEMIKVITATLRQPATIHRSGSAPTPVFSTSAR
jgi:hypothetical protein